MNEHKANRVIVYEYVRCPHCDRILLEVGVARGSLVRVKCRRCRRLIRLSV